MRKSPFSTPRGNRGQQGFGWNTSEHQSGKGYVTPSNNSSGDNSSNSNQESTSDDFIPFQSNPAPFYQDKSPKFSPRGGRQRNFAGSPGYCNNSSPRGHFNDSFTPYKRDGRPQRGRKQNVTKTPRREIPLSQYVDLKSFLEDPWKDLMNIYNSSRLNNEIIDDSINSKNKKTDVNNSVISSTCSQQSQDQNLTDKTNTKSENLLGNKNCND